MSEAEGSRRGSKYTSAVSSRHPSGDRQEPVEAIVRVENPPDQPNEKDEAVAYKMVNELLRNETGQGMLHDIIVESLEKVLANRASKADEGEPTVRAGERAHSRPVGETYARRDEGNLFSRAERSFSPTRRVNEASCEMWNAFYMQEDRSIQAVQAPSTFPEEDQIFGANKAFLQKYKVTWEKPFQRRFNGVEEKKYGNPSVDYFLRRLNQCQRICPLSRREFRDALANNCEGAAWDAVEQWVRRDAGVQDIYNRLLKQFDHRPDPSTASLKLQTMDTAKFSNWAEVEDEVRNLAERASLAKKCATEANRESLFDHLGITTLLRLMPSHVRLMAEVQSTEFSNMTGREMTFSMFRDFTNKFRQQLDEHLLQQKKTSKSRGKMQQVGPEKGKKGASGGTVAEGGRGKNSPASGSGKPDKDKPKGNRQQQQVSSGREGATSSGRGNDKRGAGREFRAEAQNGRGYENKGRSDCPKCRDPNHNGYQCPYFEGAPAHSICKECHLEGRHWPEDCPFRRKKAAHAASKEGSGGKDRTTKN